jgi:2-polyprenyl-3-methyl-5-hydroxy-6-metoxy-1,4-benzoquinol methylase
MTHAATAADGVVGGTGARYLAAAYGYEARSSKAVAAPWLRSVRPLDDLLGGGVYWLPLQRGGSVLDVGCGSGAFLARMRTLGWQVAGVEPDPAAAATAKRVHGIQVETALGNFAGRHFDAITMHHVIEHLPDAQGEVAAVADRLAPGGRLVIVTPNIHSIGRRMYGRQWVHWDPPRHLQMFSRHALQQLASTAGLDVERTWTTGRYARFVWAAGRRIRTTGRVSDAPRSLVETAGAVAFQLSEQAIGLVAPDLGEELVMIARRRAPAPVSDGAP